MLDLFYMAQFFHIFQHLLLTHNGQILQHRRHKVEHHILRGAGRGCWTSLFYMAQFFHIFQHLLLFKNQNLTVRLLNSQTLQHLRHKVEHHILWEAGKGCWTSSTWASSSTSSSTSFSSKIKTTVRLLNGQILEHLRHKVEHHILRGAGGGCWTSSTWASSSTSSSISFSSKIKPTVRLLNGQILQHHVKSKEQHCNKNPIDVFLSWELRGLSPNVYIHVSLSDSYIPRIGPHISYRRIGRSIMGIYKSLTDT